MLHDFKFALSLIVMMCLGFFLTYFRWLDLCPLVLNTVPIPHVSLHIMITGPAFDIILVDICFVINRNVGSMLSISQVSLCLLIVAAVILTAVVQSRATMQPHHTRQRRHVCHLASCPQLRPAQFSHLQMMSFSRAAAWTASNWSLPRAQDNPLVGRQCRNQAVPWSPSLQTWKSDCRQP